MPTESIKIKVVQLVRKYSSQLDKCPNRLDSINVARENLTTALEAAEKHGCGELASAVMAHEAINCPGIRDIIFTYLNDPITYLKSLESEVENFKDYL